jgi:hypothetical protein
MVLRPISSIARTVSLESSRVEKGTLSEDEEADSAAIMGERILGGRKAEGKDLDA